MRRRPRQDTIRMLANALHLESHDYRELQAARGGSPFALSDGQGRAANAGGPCELPDRHPRFIGRRSQSEKTQKLLTDPLSGPVVLTGPPGIGKTALAISSAHTLREQFTDGVFFIDLGTVDGKAPVDTMTALAAVLAGLGVAADAIPATLPGRVARFRSLSATRRILVVLDGIERSDDLALLAPPGPGKALATARSFLNGATVCLGARHVAVPPLGTDDAVALLRNALPEGAPVADELLQRLAEACGGIPLALASAAASFETDHAGSMDEYVRKVEQAGIHSPGPGGADPACVESRYAPLRSSLSAVERLALDHIRGSRLGAVSVCSTALAIGTSVGEAQRVLIALGGRHLIRPLPDDRYTADGALLRLLL